MGYKYRVVEIGEYVLIIQREKNICFKMKKKEFEEEGDIKIREIIDGISKMRKKYDVTFPENKKQMNTIYLCAGGKDARRSECFSVMLRIGIQDLSHPKGS